jgi:hypothetical protein
MILLDTQYGQAEFTGRKNCAQVLDPVPVHEGPLRGW